MQTGARILYSGVAGLGAGALAFYAVKKWGLTPGKKEETAMFAGLAVTVIVWLLLGQGVQQQPAEVAATPQPQGTNAPIPIVIGPTHIGVTLTQNPDHGNCDCGCGAIDTGLSDIFAKLADQFSASLQKNQDNYQAALMASVPDWLGSFGGLTAEHDVTALNIFSPVAGQDSVTIVAPGVVRTIKYG